MASRFEEKRAQRKKTVQVISVCRGLSQDGILIVGDAITQGVRPGAGFKTSDSDNNENMGGCCTVELRSRTRGLLKLRRGLRLKNDSTKKNKTLATWHNLAVIFSHCNILESCRLLKESHVFIISSACVHTCVDKDCQRVCPVCLSSFFF